MLSKTSANIKLGVSIVLILSLLPSAFGQLIPPIKSFSKSDYPGIDQNWMITQDQNARIYVANTEGVQIFNGLSWKTVKLPSQSIARSIYFASDSIVYCGAYETFGKINFFQDKDPEYEDISHLLMDDQVSNQEIWNIIENDQQIIFQSFSTMYVNDETGLHSVIPPTNIMFGSSIDSEILIPSMESDMYLYADNNFSKLLGTDQIPKESKVAGICKATEKEQILIATQFAGLFIYNGNDIIPLESEINELVKKERLNKLLKLDSGDFVLGTILNGLYILDKEYNIKYHINKKDGLENNTILALFEDKDANLWVGMDRGLNVIQLNSPISHYYDRDGTLGAIYAAAYHNETLYVGSNQGLFYQGVDGTFSIVENTQGQVWSLIENDGDLLCGHNNGTYLVRNGSATLICEFTGGWDMQKLKNGSILQSTYTGLITLSKENGVYYAKQIQEGNLLLREFIGDGGKFIGLHPQKGIYKFQLSADNTILTKIELMDKSRFPEEKLMHIELSDSEVYIQTSQDVYVLDSGHMKSNTNFNAAAFHPINPDSKTVYSDRVFIDNYQFDAIEPYLFQESDGFSLKSRSSPQSYEKTCDISIDYIKSAGLLTYSNTIELTASDNNIEIQLNSKNLACNVASYSYQLTNFEEKWHPIPVDGKISARNLVTGTYIVELKSLEDDAIVSLGYVVVLPHWYESKFALLLYALCGVFLIFLFYKYQQRQIRNTEIKLRDEQEKKLSQERILLRNKQLEKEVKYKSKMLANNAMALIQKNNMLGELKLHLRNARESKDKSEFQKITSLINRNMRGDKDWDIFEKNFAEVHDEFLKSLENQHEDLTSSELRLAAYIRMNLSSKEIAPLFNISVRSVENKRYRLRKKLGLQQEDSLIQYLMRF